MVFAIITNEELKPFLNLNLPFGPVPTEATIGGYKQDHSNPA